MAVAQGEKPLDSMLEFVDRSDGDGSSPSLASVAETRSHFCCVGRTISNLNIGVNCQRYQRKLLAMIVLHFIFQL